MTAHQKVIKIPSSINSVPFFQNAIPPGRRGIFHLPKMEKRFYKTLRNVNWMWFPHAAPEFFIVPTILRPIKFKDGEVFKEHYRRTMWRWGSRIPRLGLRDSFFSLSKHRFSIMKRRLCYWLKQPKEKKERIRRGFLLEVLILMPSLLFSQSNPFRIGTLKTFPDRHF